MKTRTNVALSLLAFGLMLYASGVIPAIIPQAVPAANKEGNGTKFQLFTGADPATNNCVKFDASHNIVDFGAGCGSAALGYALRFSVQSFSPVDSSTIYIGFAPGTSSTVANSRRMYVPAAGTITIAELYTYAEGVAGNGTAWSVYVRLNDTTDTLIQTLSLTTAERRWTNTGLSIAVVVGDFIEIKMVCPLWPTANPTVVTAGGYVYVVQ